MQGFHRAGRGLIAAVLVLGTGSAAAQIYVNAAGDDATPIVLSNFASAEAPLLLLAAPRAAAAAASGVRGDRGDRTRPPAGLPRPALEAIRQLIDSVAAEVRVSPRVLAAVIAAESNFDAGAVSPKGAVGLMQVLPATARRFGVLDLTVPRDNIRAGALYLKWLGELFDDDLALMFAAYNAGEQNVLNALKAGRRIPDFAETRAYVPRVLAFLGCDATAPCPRP